MGLDWVTTTYLTFMFIALYLFSFFILLAIKNRATLFHSPNASRARSVSVIIPVYNEEKSVAGTVEHVFASRYPREKMEAIVVNDGSTDTTEHVVKGLLRKYPRLRLITQPNAGKARAINHGIAAAKGELIAVVDSDSFPEPASLGKLVGYFEDKRIAAVTSFVTVRNRAVNLMTRIQSLEYMILGWSRKLLDYVDSVYVTNGPLSVYRKKAVLRVGGFDPSSITEDIDITWNLLYHGYKTGMCLDARASTLVPESFSAWFKQRTRWGMGGLQAIAKYKAMFFRRGMFGAFVLPFVSLSIIVSIFTFLFSIYLLVKFFAVRTLTVSYSLSTDSAVFTLQELNYYPSVIVYFFVVMLTLSMTYSWYILTTTRYEEHLTTKKLFNLLFYILVYLTLYPLVWFASIWRYLRRDMRWR